MNDALGALAAASMGVAWLCCLEAFARGVPHTHGRIRRLVARVAGRLAAEIVGEVAIVAGIAVAIVASRPAGLVLLIFGSAVFVDDWLNSRKPRRRRRLRAAGAKGRARLRRLLDRLRRPSWKPAPLPA